MQSWLKEWITRESMLLSLLAVMGAAGWLFIEIQDEVREAGSLEFDERVLLWFRSSENPAELRGPSWLEYVARDVTALGGTTVLALITVAVSGFFALRRQFRPLVLMLLTVLGGTLLVTVLKNLYARTRPEIIPHLMEEHTHSFPSGHTMMATVVYLSLAVMLAEFQEQRRLRVYIVGFASFLAIMIGISRVILGVHFPSDVAAGWTVGVFWSLLAWGLAHWLKKRKAGFEDHATGE